MSTQSFIRAQNVHFRMPLTTRVGQSLRANPLGVLAGLTGTGKTRKFRPLIRGMSFELKAGDRVGLIGQNGAGKTTLLRLLAGVLMPSAGTLEIRGVTQTLLNVSMGMQADATGLENIYLRGYSAGLSGPEIKRRIPEILEFAQLESVIEDPVRSYSSGMRLRLAFAVATSVKPEILLLDEWISAGDRFFVERSKERLLSHIDASEILVFASHSPQMLEELCSRGLVLKHGRVAFDGDIDAALKFYESDDYQAIEPPAPGAGNGAKGRQ
jgi:ABC-type polysaccharide/polyol phosphate transport system ATPase subunit